MRTLFCGLMLAAVAAAVGCDGKVVENTAPLTEEEKRQIAAEDKQTESEESPGNKTLKPKPGKSK